MTRPVPQLARTTGSTFGSCGRDGDGDEDGEEAGEREGRGGAGDGDRRHREAGAEQQLPGAEGEQEEAGLRVRGGGPGGEGEA